MIGDIFEVIWVSLIAGIGITASYSFVVLGTGLIVVDHEHRITAFNRVAGEITGRGHADVLGAAWRDVAGDGVDLVEVQDALDAPTLRSVRRECVVHRPDGEAVPVLMTFSILRSAAREPLGLVAACEDLSTMRRMAPHSLDLA